MANTDGSAGPRKHAAISPAGLSTLLILAAALLWSCSREIVAPAPVSSTPVVSLNLQPGWAVEPQISTSSSGVCGISTDRRVVCWGQFDGGYDIWAPTGSFTQVAVANDFACALGIDGEIQCWGMLPPPPPSGPFVKFSMFRAPVPDSHACAIRTDSTLTCWGRNDVGQAIPPAGAFVEVSTSNNTSCALRSDGSLACWGAGAAQAANALGGGVYTAVEALEGGSVCVIRPDQTVACAGYTAPAGQFTKLGGLCGIRVDATVACWSSLLPAVPADFAGSRFIDVAEGYRGACALRDDAHVRCWPSDYWSDIDLEGNAAQGPYFGVEGSAVTFNAAEGYSSYVWDFGDGHTGSGRVVTHVYQDDGVFTVVLSTNGPSGISTGETNASIGDLPVEVTSIELPDGAVVGRPLRVQVTFNDPGSADGPWDYNAATYFLDEDGVGGYVGPIFASGTRVTQGVFDFTFDTPLVAYPWLRGYKVVVGFPNHRSQFWGFFAPTPENTEPGSGVSVTPVDPASGTPAPATFTFDNVTQGGTTTMQSSTIGQTGSPPAPANFQVGDPATYYDIATTATYNGSIIICIDYSGTAFGNEGELALLHYEQGAWTNVTTSLNPTTNIICGSVASLSPFVVAEFNRPPLITGIGLPAAPVAAGIPVTISASFSDPNPRDHHASTISWGDGAASTGIVSESSGAGSVLGIHTFPRPGVYTITVTVDDGVLSGSRSTSLDAPAYVVVYDPGAGFVTGGGWISSPTGAFTANPALTGKASFGFVAKYQKGATAPSGNTEFRFQMAGLTFTSTAYQWLVVAGAKAQFKGVGTLNGVGTYGFLVSAIDGEVNGGKGVDRFRIKLWDTVTGGIVYDNQVGAADDVAATTALGGGSIVIHP